MALWLWLGLSACNREEGRETNLTQQDEAKVEAPRKRSALEIEADRLSIEELEVDPEKRSAITSKKADNARDWALQCLRDTYRLGTDTDPAWDARVDVAFIAYCDYTRKSTSLGENLSKAVKALADIECKDPMVAYLKARYLPSDASKTETAKEFLQAHEKLARSDYHPAFKFISGYRSVEACSWADPESDPETRCVWTTIHLEDLARDKSAPIDEVFNAVHMWFSHRQSKAWRDYVMYDLEKILKDHWEGEEPWYAFMGLVEVERAWGARGGGYADTVTEAGWKAFVEHLTKAESALESAWKLNPKNASTAYNRMQVELGQGRGLQHMKKWYQHAIDLAPNYYDAIALMALYLEPRWYGSSEESLGYARSVVKSETLGGRAPLVLPNTHWSLAKYHSKNNSPAYWHNPSVWNDIKTAYEKYFQLNPKQVGWNQEYARDAYTCGKYDVFLEQVQGLNETNYTVFGGREAFIEMVKKARNQIE